MQVKKGDKVRYHPIIGGPHDGKVYECHCDMSALGSGKTITQIVHLSGKSGCVAVEALSPVE